LLAGHSPFRASSVEDLEELVSESHHPPALDDVPADLAAICYKCLEKNPARRYATADDLAGDLERFLADQPVQARPLAWTAICVRHAMRRPFTAAFSVILAVLVSVGAVAHQATERSRIRTHEQAIRVANNLADRLADLTALQFEHYMAAVATVAQDPAAERAIADPSLAHEVFERLTGHLVRPHTAAFATANVFDTEGTMLARAPFVAVDNRGRSYQFRDYFQGAAELARQGQRKPYVSRAYRSEADGNFEVAISSPVFDASGRWVGVLVGGLYSGSTLGTIELTDDWKAGLTAALLAPRDRERGQAEPDPNPIVVVHRALGLGEARPADPEDVLGTGGYVRIAPVRRTPFSVLVRVEFDEPR
jgi:serine/threonine-protein kinase